MGPGKSCGVHVSDSALERAVLLLPDPVIPIRSTVTDLQLAFRCLPACLRLRSARRLLLAGKLEATDREPATVQRRVSERGHHRRLPVRKVSWRNNGEDGLSCSRTRGIPGSSGQFLFGKLGQSIEVSCFQRSCSKNPGRTSKSQAFRGSLVCVVIALFLDSSPFTKLEPRPW